MDGTDGLSAVFNTLRSFESEAVPGTIPQGQNNPRCVRFGLYAEQMTASAFVAPRAVNRHAYLYRVRPAVAHKGFVCCSLLFLPSSILSPFHSYPYLSIFLPIHKAHRHDEK